jgi:hypothetical protein
VREILCKKLVPGAVPLVRKQVPCLESLAYMLAKRRATVTVPAGTLGKARLITYKRGRIKIEDRARLEEASCDCDGTLSRRILRWQHEAEESGKV